MEIKKTDKGISLISFEDTAPENRGEYFPKKKEPLFSAYGSDEIYTWFENNLYPQLIIDELAKGFLGSIVNREIDYTIGTRLDASDQNTLNYIDAKNIINHKNQNFRQVYNDIIMSYTLFKLCFIRAITDENRSFLWLIPIQPQKCRLKRKNKDKPEQGYDKVVIRPDWKNSASKTKQEIPIYPKMKIFQNKEMRLLETVFYFRKEVYGKDWYSINNEIHKSLIHNEKIYRRHNWQNSQIKRGFKRDFILTTDYPLLEAEQKKIEEKINTEQSGDNKAGGVASVSAEGAKLTAVQDNYRFDWEKDDTVDAIFMNMQMPRSLFGIKSGGAFSVEQVESDWNQYMTKIIPEQDLVNSQLNWFLSDIMGYSSDISTINRPPEIIIQNYLQHMPEDKLGIFYDELFKKFGYESNNKS